MELHVQCKKKLDNLFLVLHTNILVSQSGPTYLPGMMRSSNCLRTVVQKKRTDVLMCYKIELKVPIGGAERRWERVRKNQVQL